MKLWLTCHQCQRRFSVPLESKRHPLFCQACLDDFDRLNERRERAEEIATVVTVKRTL